MGLCHKRNRIIKCMNIRFALAWYMIIITTTVILCYYSLYPLVTIADKFIRHAEYVYEEAQRD